MKPQNGPCTRRSVPNLETLIGQLWVKCPCWEAEIVPSTFLRPRHASRRREVLETLGFPWSCLSYRDDTCRNTGSEKSLKHELHFGFDVGRDQILGSMGNLGTRCGLRSPRVGIKKLARRLLDTHISGGVLPSPQPRTSCA